MLELASRLGQVTVCHQDPIDSYLHPSSDLGNNHPTRCAHFAPTIIVLNVAGRLLIPHMARNSKAVLVKPISIAQIGAPDAALPDKGASELPCPVASVEPLEGVAVAVHTSVSVVSAAGGNQLAKAGWKS